jgi:predicted N-acetyltransferase YhbS
MNIRAATINDLPAIGTIHAFAFDNRASEAAIVIYHHLRPQFDAELSLVAEIDGQIVGHALFSPQTMRFSGQSVNGVNLAPIGVAPAFQGQGVGSALMEEGHRIALQKGFALSFLLGHADYYPRFGYLTHAYGFSEVTIDVSNYAMKGLATRSPVAADIPTLYQFWQHEERGVDFTLDPGTALLDWISPNATMRSMVFTYADEMVGYARQEVNGQVRVFHAQDHDMARKMAKFLAGNKGEVILPLHPHSASTGAFPEVPTCQAMDVCMVLPLEISAFDDYYAGVQSGEREAGRPVWGVAFEF